MNKLNILALIGVLIIAAGFVFAISGAKPTVVSEYRWTGNASENDTTEGGNITLLNVAATVLTDKWAAYYGNVSGTLLLGNNSSYVYSWAWTNATGGEVCVSQDSAFDFTAVTTAAAADINSVWSFGNDADNATNTFKTTTCNLTFATSNVTGTATADHNGATTTFETCAVDNGTNAAENDFAFCANIQGAGTAWDGKIVHYEVMVPTTEGGAGVTETYFFFAELS